MDEATLAGIEAKSHALSNAIDRDDVDRVFDLADDMQAYAPALVAEVRRLAAALDEQRRENERLRESAVISDALGYLWMHAPARRDEIRSEALALGLRTVVEVTMRARRVRSLAEGLGDG